MAENNEPGSVIADGVKSVFLAGVGAVAYGGEKGKALIDTLIAKGEMTIDQGKQMNQELQYKASAATKDLREAAIEAHMKAMSPEEREAYVAHVVEIAAKHNAAEEAAAVEVEVVDAEEVAQEAAAEAQDASVEAPAEAAPSETAE